MEPDHPVRAGGTTGGSPGPGTPAGSGNPAVLDATVRAPRSARADMRPVWAEVDLAALRHNAATLARISAPSRLCAVVKADAYGHGAVPAARAALEGGASSLAVAFVEEGIELRRAGVGAPILLLAEPGPDGMAEAAAQGLTPTLYSRRGLMAAADAARAGATRLPVHVKVDTGMHRVGAAPEEAVEIAKAAAASDELDLEGAWTHLAVADEVDDSFTGVQLGRFADVLAKLRGAGVQPPVVHAANSAGTISHPAARLDMVRCGIALYGHAPSEAVGRSVAGAGEALRPVLTLRARVSHVRELAAGESVSYGRRYQLRRDSLVATVPVGYADGVPRRLFEAGASMLIGGVRRPIAGAVTMDQVLLDCGPGAHVAVGDEVVIMGGQGGETVSAEEWAGLLGTISYEVLTGIGPRVPRVLVEGT